MRSNQLPTLPPCSPVGTPTSRDSITWHRPPRAPAGLSGHALQHLPSRTSPKQFSSLRTQSDSSAGPLPLRLQLTARNTLASRGGNVHFHPSACHGCPSMEGRFLLQPPKTGRDRSERGSSSRPEGRRARRSHPRRPVPTPGASALPPGGRRGRGTQSKPRVSGFQNSLKRGPKRTVSHAGGAAAWAPRPAFTSWPSCWRPGVSPCATTGTASSPCETAPSALTAPTSVTGT